MQTSASRVERGRANRLNEMRFPASREGDDNASALASSRGGHDGDPANAPRRRSDCRPPLAPPLARYAWEIRWSRLHPFAATIEVSCEERSSPPRRFATPQ